MSRFRTEQPSSRLIFRGTLLFCAAILGALAIWIVALEFYRPKVAFPTDIQEAAKLAAKRDATIFVATWGMIRGDLWAECALTNLDLAWLGNGNNKDPVVSMNAVEVAKRALSYSPHDSRVWLALAAADGQFEWLHREAADALRVSYYTGANRSELIPLRLLLAVRSGAIDEKDIKDLASHDIRTIITRMPELKPAITSAYRDALPTGRKFLEEALEEIDPVLIKALRSKG